PKKQLEAHKTLGDKVRIVEFGSAPDEARWIVSEIERLHKAAPSVAPWKSFAALYRIHAHRDELVTAFEERGIAFLIRNTSILSQRLVLIVREYLELIARSSNDIACARVLGAPGLGFTAEDLVRLTERAATNRKPLWDELQAPQAELPFVDKASQERAELI